MKGKYVMMSFVFLVFGFILAFSYSQSKKEENIVVEITGRQYTIENNLRNQLISTQERNRELQKQLYDEQERVREIEKELSHDEHHLANLAENAEKYRMFLGKVAVQGQGVEVKLEDGEYKQDEDINNYLVHENHVFKVVNELYIAGAAVVAINGQRLNHDSYIVCNGPVITVDGNPFPAPFKISAIGDPDILVSALSLSGGVRDQLVNDNVVFSLEKKKNLIIDPILGDSAS
ncbi:DUF881 domain-containing protein [Pseudogracilibacillus auburnensis]|uniref:DUF881 domain-containing protein n=1 Tax=Pseudogracilibacillus auburnensis TaxID=1494959 RepID=UPI001A973D96|nr:DUF881 domain-containing protein [Pseudogracilibacillus auburnensis]MBO1004939.1 DUF881 domain-containing protein [Pseudogracilibacillus auburnensis]